LKKNNIPNGWLNSTTTPAEVEAVIENELNPTTEEMTMGEVIKQLNILTKGDAVIVTDVGQHQMVACRYAKLTKPAVILPVVV
jgi:acetolactate synthase-1/2/3 large subunit